jgi:hypothetical protein
MLIKCAGIGRLALCASLITALAACSHSPSESDAKAVIKSRLENCDYLSLDSFDRVNGIAQGDQYYNVAVAYSISLSKPDSDIRDRFKEQAKLTNRIAELQKESADSMKASQEQFHEYEQAHPDDTDASVHFDAEDSGKTLRDKNRDEINELSTQLAQDNAAATWLNRLRSSCPRAADSWLYTIKQVPMQALLDGDGKMNFTETIAMIKTDNGWQAAR